MGGYVPEREVVIVGAARLPIGKHGGSYSSFSSVRLTVEAIKVTLQRAGLHIGHGALFNVGDGKINITIDEIITAAPTFVDPSYQHIYTGDIAHRIGLPTINSFSVQRICGSGFQAIATALDTIKAERYKAVIVTGAENMTRAPQIYTGSRKKDAVWEFENEGEYKDSIFLSLRHAMFDTFMAKTAEDLAKGMGITRIEIDDYALQSYARLAYAQKHQWNKDERLLNLKGHLRGIARVTEIDREQLPLAVIFDQGHETTANQEMVRRKKPIPGLELVTPGNASKAGDGAACLVLMERAYADKQGLAYTYGIKGYCEATCDPRIMGIAPAPAIEMYLEKTKTKRSDYDLFYVNEAFAAQVLAVIKRCGLPMDRTNPNGGAIAHGHPISATGLILTVDAMNELERIGGKRALATACIGGGQAIVMEIYEV